jgi:hypothetical protein
LLIAIVIGVALTYHHIHKQDELEKQQEEKREEERQKADETKIDHITHKMFDICDRCSLLPKDSDDYYTEKLIEIGVRSLGEVPLDTTLARLNALENKIKSVKRNNEK